MEAKFEHLVAHIHKPGMTAYLKKHPDEFKHLVKLACADKQPYSWRAAWLLWSCMVKNDPRVKPFVKKIIEIILDRKPNQQRELMMVLQRMELTDKESMVLFDKNIKIWQKRDIQPSVRFNAFRLMNEISKRFPELRQEVIALADNYYVDSLSPGVRHSIKRLINEPGVKY